MGRRQLFTEDAIIGAARALAASDGPAAATMQAVARQLGAPIGSLYHRFPSRDGLLARTWLDTVAQFQEGFLGRLREPATPVGEIARYTLAFCKQQPEHAALILIQRREEFLGQVLPPALAERARDLEEALAAGMRRFARERLYSSSPTAVRRAAFAVLDIPQAAVRPHLARGEPIPPYLGDMVARAAEAVFPSAETPP